MDRNEKIIGDALGTVSLIDGEVFSLADVKLLMNLARADLHPAQDQVQWVVNDIAELGVKVGYRFFWLYKGESLCYGKDPSDVIGGIVQHDNGGDMHWRPVFKREFGECAHPLNRSDYSKIGTVSLDDSEQWEPLPAFDDAMLAAREVKS